MSHFSVMVITDEQPTEENQLLEKALAPYHEFECTGLNDQYVQDVDQTQEAIDAYKSQTEAHLVGPNGESVSKFDDRFYREFTDDERKELGSCLGTGWGGGKHWTSKDWEDGKGYRTKIHFVPEGWTEKEVLKNEVQSFAQFCESWYGKTIVRESDFDAANEEYKYGYTLVNDEGEVLKVIDRTNPSKKWDYWRVGGRYRSKLQVKECCLSAVSSDPSWEFDADKKEPPKGFDSARVGDIDWDLMSAKARAGRLEWVLECIKKNNQPVGQFEVGCNLQKEAHELWMKLEEKPRGHAYDEWLREVGYGVVADARKGNWEIPEIGELSLVQWIDSAPSLSAFAVVKNGNWYERGEMGWWGCVAHEDGEWDEKFSELLKTLWDDQWLTFVDCHI